MLFIAHHHPDARREDGRVEGRNALGSYSNAVCH